MRKKVKMSLFYQKAVGLDKKAIYLGHGQPDSLYDLYHDIATRLFRRVLRDGGGASFTVLPVSGGAGLEEDIAGLPIRLGYRVAGHILLSVLSLVVCPAQRGLPALFRLAVYLLLPDRPFPHEAGRAGGIPASPLSRTRAAGAGDVGLVVLRAFRRAAGDREGESGGDSRGVRVVYPLFYPQAPAEGCFRPLVLYPYAGAAGVLL